MTSVLVGIPWRPQTDRVYAHDLVAARYAELLPDARIVDVDTTHEPFCLAGCRNLAVKMAELDRADVVVLGDADTLPEQEPLLAAIEAAATTDVVHLPYTEYRSLRADGSAQHADGTPLADCAHLIVDGACSGVYVTSPATWWAHGGQDERHLGWGAEDASWWCAHTTLLGAEPVRHPGRVYAFSHESQRKDGPHYAANFALCHRYHRANGNVEAMQSLIAERPAASVHAERMDRGG